MHDVIMEGENRASETGGKQANSCLCWAFSGDQISQTAEPRDKKTRCFLTFLGKTSVDIMQELCFFFSPWSDIPALNHLYRRGCEQSVGQEVDLLHDV